MWKRKGLVITLTKKRRTDKTYLNNRMGVILCHKTVPYPLSMIFISRYFRWNLGTQAPVPAYFLQLTIVPFVNILKKNILFNLFFNSNSFRNTP